MKELISMSYGSSTRELSTIVNCLKGKQDSLERGNCWGLILTDQILKIADGIIKKLMRQQLNMEMTAAEMEFSLMPGCEIPNAMVPLRQLQEKY